MNKPSAQTPQPEGQEAAVEVTKPLPAVPVVGESSTTGRAVSSQVSTGLSVITGLMTVVVSAQQLLGGGRLFLAIGGTTVGIGVMIACLVGAATLRRDRHANPPNESGAREARQEAVERRLWLVVAIGMCVAGGLVLAVGPSRQQSTGSSRASGSPSPTTSMHTSTNAQVVPLGMGSPNVTHDTGQSSPNPIVPPGPISNQQPGPGPANTQPAQAGTQVAQSKPTPAPAPSTHAPAPPPSTALQPGDVRHPEQAITLKANVEMANLDAPASEPTYGAGQYDGSQWDTPPHYFNIVYTGSSINVDGGDRNIALLGTGGGWDYYSCRIGVSYGASASGAAISPGNGICVLTPNGHQALLVVDANTGSAITLDITVYE